MTYEQMDWLPWSIDQLDRCLEFGSIDKVLIAEGAHSKNDPARSPDGSWDYLNDRVDSNKDYVLFDAEPFRNKYSRYDFAQAALLNHMWATFPENEESWMFLVQDDMFFFDVFLKNVRTLCENASKEKMDMVITKQMAFSFNMQLYWRNRSAYILTKRCEGSVWKPTSKLFYSDGVPYLKKINKIKFDPKFEYITFHFGNVKTMAREKTRYAMSAEKGTPNSMEWFNKVWLAADLNNLDAAYEANRQIYGAYGFKPDSPDMGPVVWQTLDIYKGEYPEILRTHPYMNIEDIRKV